ncbi:leucine-rich repeat extensin-like protein 1 [Melanaphis sacchari]|uniref:leucine-rich repeat extensin-like protein 1 n=1 Tax=Melanaphis sacchari TaxID=742174 RepID=UPI000DC12DCD|nr:leucine-rich repeat extensin-like protein 1 [Melanaphis sacchari]
MTKCIKIKLIIQSSLGMKWSTLVACLIVCLLDLKVSDGISSVPCSQAALSLQDSSLKADQPPIFPSSLAPLLTTLCSSSTLNGLPPSAIVSIVNTLSATPELFKTLPPPTLVALLSAVSSSPTVLNELSPISVLVLLAAVSSATPTSISSIPRAVLFPLLKTLSYSGLLPPPGSVQPNTVFTQLPPLPPPPPQIIVPGPALGPMYINLPNKSPKPPPIIIPTGPPPSIVVSIPQPYPAPPPLIMPYGTPGPIVINEGQNTSPLTTQTVLSAPEPPKIFFTTHPSKSCLNSIDGRTSQQNYCQSQFEIPKVYALPPGVLPNQYFQIDKKRA